MLKFYCELVCLHWYVYLSEDFPLVEVSFGGSFIFCHVLGSKLLKKKNFSKPPQAMSIIRAHLSLIPRIIKPLASINIVSGMRVSSVSGSSREVPLRSNMLVSELLTQICSQKGHMRRAPQEHCFRENASCPRLVGTAPQTAPSARCCPGSGEHGPDPGRWRPSSPGPATPHRAPGRPALLPRSQARGCRGSFRPGSRLQSRTGRETVLRGGPTARGRTSQAGFRQTPTVHELCARR